jgi:hypothetical protein
VPSGEIGTNLLVEHESIAWVHHRFLSGEGTSPEGKESNLVLLVLDEWAVTKRLSDEGSSRSREGISINSDSGFTGLTLSVGLE